MHLHRGITCGFTTHNVPHHDDFLVFIRAISCVCNIMTDRPDITNSRIGPNTVGEWCDLARWKPRVIHDIYWEIVKEKADEDKWNKDARTLLVAQHARVLEEALEKARKAAELQLEKVRGQFARRIEQLGRRAEIRLARKIRRDALSQDDAVPLDDVKAGKAP